MAYRTILVHVDRSAASAVRARLAARLAEREGAHLVATAMSGLRRYMYAGSPFDYSGAIAAEYLEQAEQEADDALARFDEVVAGIGVASVERRKRQEDEYHSLCVQARYADLVVLGQPTPDDAGWDSPMPDLPPYVVLNCGRPVLLVPNAGESGRLDGQALIPWNGSVQAARAVTAAIPLLRRMAKVTVALFGPAGGEHGEEPGADIALYLARHRLAVEVQCCPAPSDAGEAILSLAADLGAGLLVMGAYGHSRFREMLLGGATRTVLARMTVPVLMAH